LFKRFNFSILIIKSNQSNAKIRYRVRLFLENDRTERSRPLFLPPRFPVQFKHPSIIQGTNFRSRTRPLASLALSEVEVSPPRPLVSFLPSSNPYLHGIHNGFRGDQNEVAAPTGPRNFPSKGLLLVKFNRFPFSALGHPKAPQLGENRPDGIEL